MKKYTLTSQIDELVQLMSDAWFYGCITVADTGGFDCDLNDF